MMLRRYLTVLLTALGLIAAVNGVMDPFDVLGAPHIAGFNDRKSPGNDRFFRPLQVSARQPKTVFLGNSRIANALDPSSFPQLDAYNLAVPAATMIEEVAFARHAMADSKISRMVLGLDLLSFDDAMPPAASSRLDELGPHLLWRSMPQLLLSEQALVRSRGTLLNSRHRHPAEPPSGDPAQAVLKEVRGYRGLFQSFSGATDRSFATLDGLLAEARAAGITVTAVIPPAHAGLTEALAAAGGLPAYRDWLRRLATLCDAHGVRLWDFSGYTRIGTVALSDSFSTFSDGSHVLPWVGTAMLKTVLENTADADFATALTAAGLDAHLARQQSARETWRHNNPADWQKIAAALGKD